jgi:hypothetical protein
MCVEEQFARAKETVKEVGKELTVTKERVAGVSVELEKARVELLAERQKNGEEKSKNAV